MKHLSSVFQVHTSKSQVSIFLEKSIAKYLPTYPPTYIVLREREKFIESSAAPVDTQFSKKLQLLSNSVEREETCTVYDMDQIGEPLQSQNLEGFSLLVGITNGVGILLVILVIVWTSHFRLGFAWTSDPQREFNWHPLLMTIGFVFLYSNAMLLYRIQRTVRKRRLKLLHGGIMLFILLFVVIALVAVFDSHNLNTKDGKPAPIPNMYSLHSWIGMTTVILFCCQWVTGCVSFMYPGLQAPLRAAYMPIHVYFGTAGFVGAVTSCLLGLNEKAIFSLSTNYSAFSPEGVLINVIGLFFIIFGGLTVYLISQPRYKRLPRPEDDVLLAGRTE